MIKGFHSDFVNAPIIISTQAWPSAKILSGSGPTWRSHTCSGPGGNDGSLLSRHVFSMAACFSASGGRARGIEIERFRVNTPDQKTFNFDSGFSLRSCRHLLCKRDDVALSCTKGCAAACNQSRGGRALQRCRAAITCASGYVLAAVRVARQAGGSTLRGAPGMHDACAAIKAGAGQPESCPGATQLRV